jgi:hypothetical protein
MYWMDAFNVVWCETADDHLWAVLDEDEGPRTFPRETVEALRGPLREHTQLYRIALTFPGVKDPYVVCRSSQGQPLISGVVANATWFPKDDAARLGNGFALLGYRVEIVPRYPEVERDSAPERWPIDG